MKRIIFSLTLAVLLAMGFQNCGKLRGTDTGNPMQGSSTLNMGSGSSGSHYVPTLEEDLTLKICEVIVTCHPSAKFSDCSPAIFSLSGLGARFGGPAASALKDLRSASRTSVPASRCIDQLDALKTTCSVAQVADSYSSQTNSFSGAINLIPTSGDCPAVYVP
jgi:hypothetical protein